MSQGPPLLAGGNSGVTKKLSSSPAGLARFTAPQDLHWLIRKLYETDVADTRVLQQNIHTYCTILPLHQDFQKALLPFRRALLPGPEPTPPHLFRPNELSASKQLIAARVGDSCGNLRAGPRVCARNAGLQKIAIAVQKSVQAILGDDTTSLKSVQASVKMPNEMLRGFAVEADLQAIDDPKTCGGTHQDSGGFDEAHLRAIVINGAATVYIMPATGAGAVALDVKNCVLLLDGRLLRLLFHNVLSAEERRWSSSIMVNLTMNDPGDIPILTAIARIRERCDITPKKDLEFDWFQPISNTFAAGLTYKSWTQGEHNRDVTGSTAEPLDDDHLFCASEQCQAVLHQRAYKLCMACRNAIAAKCKQSKCVVCGQHDVMHEMTSPVDTVIASTSYGAGHAYYKPRVYKAVNNSSAFAVKYGPAGKLNTQDVCSEGCYLAAMLDSFFEQHQSQRADEMTRRHFAPLKRPFKRLTKQMFHSAVCIAIERYPDGWEAIKVLALDDLQDVECPLFERRCGPYIKNGSGYMDCHCNKKTGGHSWRKTPR
jgi:hypothetical protein